MDTYLLKRTLIPSIGQFLAGCALSLVVFVFIFRDLLLTKLLNHGSNDFKALAPYLQQSAAIELGRLSQLAATDLIVKAVFFAGIGLIAYIIFLSVSNIFIEARNQVVIQAEYTNKGNVSARARRPFLQVAAAVGLFLFLLFAAQVLLPLWLSLFQGFVLHTTPTALIGLVISLAGAALTGFWAYSFTKLVFAIN